MEGNSFSYRISRRRFMEMAAGLTVLAACGDSGGDSGPVATGVTSTLLQPTTKLSGDLKILQWSHFVPRHDEWFDPFAADWGRQVGVNVTIDHITVTDIPARPAAEIAANEGHDLIELIAPPSALEHSVLDLSDVNQEAEDRFGDRLE